MSVVSVTPAGAEAFTHAGHLVLIEEGAGISSGFTDDFYQAAGGEIVGSADDVWARAEMIMKVKEPLPEEYDLIRPGQTVFTYFHFAASRELTEGMIENSHLETRRCFSAASVKMKMSSSASSI